jgi:hypothetical protein
MTDQPRLPRDYPQPFQMDELRIDPENGIDSKSALQ